MYIKNRTDEEFIVRPLGSLALMRWFSPQGLSLVIGENRRPSGFVRLFIRQSRKDRQELRRGIEPSAAL